MSVHLPKGTRDYLPDQLVPRLRVVDRVRPVFERYGFQPLETPAFERIETLTGKYGDEGQKLIFKILKRGEGEERGEADQALRYDLTVPLARVVAMNPQLRLPFKRYQIAPVWRADRPAKGRFREFVQCDVDTVGSASLAADAECVAVLHDALRALGLEAFTIRINDRRVLRATAAAIGAADREGALLVAVDKLDKVGRDGVTAELVARGFDPAQADGLWTLLERGASNAGTIDHLREELGARTTGAIRAQALAGLEDLTLLLELAAALGAAPDRLRIDPTLARGLDYYTGPVFEVTADDVSIGSLGGGGRYDGLIGMFSGRSIPAVGCSLGLDRIVVVLEEKGLLGGPAHPAEVLVAVWDDENRTVAAQVAGALRARGIRTELFLGDGKLKQQLKYANAKGYPFLLVMGPAEARRGVVALKDLHSGDQEELPLEEAADRILDRAWASAGTNPA